MAKKGDTLDIKETTFEMEGVVIDIARNEIEVELVNKHRISAHLAGKLRLHSIKIMIGDKVRVEMSPYDLTKGRIIWRDKN